MIIYHGSTVPVEEPKILKSERMLDFGEGFYATFNYEQAVRWTERVAAKRETNLRVITEYEFDLQTAEKELTINRFEKAEDKWLDFISMNRSGRLPSEPYDIAIGPVADDIVYTTITLYEQGILDRDETIKRLKVQELFNQILFHTDKSLKFCQYIKHYKIGGK